MSTAFPIKINASGELPVVRCQCASPTSSRADLDAKPLPQATPAQVDREKSSYGQILKSSALVGGSQVANIAIGIVRTKAMAILLGPAGFGLFGLYGSIQNLTQSIAGMGINSSGVRQIAEAVGAGDAHRIGKTAAILRRTALLLGALGAILLFVFSRPISILTFGTPQRARSVALLSVAILFTLIAGGQMALIQGMRRISDLARINIFGAVLGLCTGIPLVYFFRQGGVVPSLISVAAMTILTSWWFSRKIEVQVPKVSISEVWHEASALLKLGAAFMASGLMTMGVAYFVRVLLVQKVSMEATGLYQSAWTLGGLYVTFILQAMGADFFPRLTSRIHNHDDANRLVNEQTLVGLLLAGPGVLATLTFAPVVIALFYSAKFAAAVPVLRWICLGVLLQVITWPMGFIIVAKGKPVLFFVAELAWTIVAITLSWLSINHFGLNGAGIAFFGSYVFHLLLIYPIAHGVTGFRWSTANQRNALIFFSTIAVVFCTFFVLPIIWSVLAGAGAAIGSAAYSLRTLLDMIPVHRLPKPIHSGLLRFGVLTPDAR